MFPFPFLTSSILITMKGIPTPMATNVTPITYYNVKEIYLSFMFNVGGENTVSNNPVLNALAMFLPLQGC